MSIERRQVIARSLRAAALQFRFPPNQPICIRELEHKYSVSSIPIREILIELSNERLIDFIPGRGFFGRGMDPNEIESTFDLLGYFMIDFARYINRSQIQRNSFKAMIENISGPTESIGTYYQAIPKNIPSLLARNYRQPHTKYFLQVLERTFNFVRMESELCGSTEDMTIIFQKYIQLTIAGFMDEIEKFISIYIQEKKKGVRDVAHYFS